MVLGRSAAEEESVAIVTFRAWAYFDSLQFGIDFKYYWIWKKFVPGVNIIWYTSLILCASIVWLASTCIRLQSGS